MPRPKNTPQPAAEMPEILPAKRASIQANQDAVALATAQAEAKTRALAQQLRYEGSLLPEALENSAREAIRRINMSVFELGAYLLLLRSECPHGDFMARLERLDLEPRVAQRYMQITQRFAPNASAPTYLMGLSKGKLAEMLVLDDEQIDELALTGKTGELAADDLATMSVRELRESCRRERAKVARLTEVNSELNTELALKKHLKLAPTDWPDRFKGLMDQVAQVHRAMRQSIDALDAVQLAAVEDAAASPEEEASLQRARATLAEEIVRVHRSCTERLEAFAVLFDKTLGSYAPEKLLG